VRTHELLEVAESLCGTFQKVKSEAVGRKPDGDKRFIHYHIIMDEKKVDGMIEFMEEVVKYMNSKGDSLKE